MKWCIFLSPQISLKHSIDFVMTFYNKAEYHDTQIEFYSPLLVSGHLRRKRKFHILELNLASNITYFCALKNYRCVWIAILLLASNWVYVLRFFIELVYICWGFWHQRIWESWLQLGRFSFQKKETMFNCDNALYYVSNTTFNLGKEWQFKLRKTIAQMQI